MDIINADTHTFDMVYTEDMSAMMRFAEGNMAIVDGRGLTPSDSAGGTAVCVLSREVAEAYDLHVGDAITMKLGTELFEQYKGLGAVAATRERYKPAEKSVTLEIVGIYADTDGQGAQKSRPNWSYSINTIFVPKSLLPVEDSALAGHMFSPSEFTFKVENAWDIEAFIEESAPKFQEMGLRLIFDDGDWPAIEDAFKAARQLSLIKIAVFSAAVAAATGFVVYLYIGRKKKEYAVMRALGTTRKVSARTLLLPLSAVAAASVLAGSGAAWLYTVMTVAHNNTLSMMKDYAVSTSVPAGAVISCILGEMLLTLLFALMLLRRVGSLSPLALLQDSGSNRFRGKQKANRVKMSQGIKARSHNETTSLPSAATLAPRVDSSSYGPTAAETATEDDISKTAANTYRPTMSSPSGNAAVITNAKDAALPGDSGLIHKGRKPRSFRFTLRYIGRHMRRSAGKSVLAILLAALLFAAVGQLALMKEAYVRLCAETVIVGRFVGGLPLSNAFQIAQYNYEKDLYFEFRETVDLNFSEESLVITNNIARYTSEETTITYADGYDASVMESVGKFIVAGKALMQKYGLELGDTVSISPRRYLANLEEMYITGYRTEHPEDTITDGEILALKQDEITKQLNSVRRTYTIVGVVSTPSGAFDGMAFTPGDSETSIAVGKSIALDAAEFTLADNMLADRFRSFCESMAGSSTFVMDTSKLENLRNTLRLLEMMYPIAMVAALLIGGFLCCLVIVQASKEAAIMRVQGTTKRRTRTIVLLEQVLLSILGLLIGTVGLLAYKGEALAVISGQLALFAALYFAVILLSAVICSSLATRRNVLELLQTKE